MIKCHQLTLTVSESYQPFTIVSRVLLCPGLQRRVTTDLPVILVSLIAAHPFWPWWTVSPLVYSVRSNHLEIFPTLRQIHVGKPTSPILLLPFLWTSMGILAFKLCPMRAIASFILLRAILPVSLHHLLWSLPGGKTQCLGRALLGQHTPLCQLSWSYSAPRESSPTQTLSCSCQSHWPHLSAPLNRVHFFLCQAQYVPS